jgi:teichuronic acid biosynthesis glycosyltransferase TuaC
MRILVLPKEFPSAAQPMAGIFILRRVQALRELGHEIEVLRIVPAAPPITAKWRTYAAIPAQESVEGISVRTIRAIFPPRMIAMEYLPLQVHAAVAREVARFRPDVIHASFLIPSGQIAVRQRVPAVVTAHGGDAYAWPKKRPGLYRAAREAIEKAARVTAVSSYIGRCVSEISPRTVDVIWNGGDERFFYPRDRAQARAALQLPDDRFVVGFAGNLLRAKGVFDVIEAAQALRDWEPLVLFAGAGGDEPVLREASRRARVDARFLGRLDQDGIAQLYAAADVVTLPSYNEGMPNVVCEAMLSGRAVVASTVGGTPEIVESERTGLLVEPGNAGQLRDALARIAANAELRVHLERQAREFAEAHLTWRISAQRYDRVLREAANVS